MASHAHRFTRKQWHDTLRYESHYEAFDELVEILQEAVEIEGAWEMADRCNVSLQTIHNWIDHRIMFPHFKTICKVAEGLGLHITFTKRVVRRTSNRRLRSVK